LLAAVTERSRNGRPIRLRDLVHDADWLDRAIPTFDELSYGLPRLIQAGYVTVETGPRDGLLFRATAQATEVRRSLKPRRLGDVVIGFEREVGTVAYAGKEPPEDRSLGRLPGLKPDDLDAAVKEHAAWVARWSWPLVIVARALTRWQNRGR